MTPPGDAPRTLRPRGRIFYGWYVVAASVATNFYISLTFFQGFQAFFLPILNEFQWSRTLMSGAFSLRQLEDGMLAPVIGVLVDRWGPRRVILTGVVIAGAGMIFLAHTSRLDPTAYDIPYPFSGQQGHLPEMDADILIVGHTHIPTVHREGSLLIVNPGTCGDPRDPLTPGRLSYAVLDTATWQTAIREFRLNGAVGNDFNHSH